MAFQCASQVSLGADEIALAITHGLLGSHLGIAFSDASGVGRLAHLAFHRMFVVEPFPPAPAEWAASKISMPLSLASQLSALLQMASQKYKFIAADAASARSIDYGINLFAGQGALAQDGAYSPGEGCDGYTCASFVAETFRLFAFPLVDLATWEASAQNAAWGDAIVCLLTAHGVGPEHLNAVQANISGLRLRPEEVAAAGELPASKRPASFADLQGRAQTVFAEMLSVCGPPTPPPSKFEFCVSQYQAALNSLGPAP